jgi:hypothetical protein
MDEGEEEGAELTTDEIEALSQRMYTTLVSNNAMEIKLAIWFVLEMIEFPYLWDMEMLACFSTVVRTSQSRLPKYLI